MSSKFETSQRAARGLAASAALLACLVFAPTARAQHLDGTFDWTRANVAPGQLVSVEVRVDGHRVPLYRGAEDLNRHYFAAERGENYALRIRNRTGRRVGVLIAVDGLNVVNGERSRLGRGEPMYVLDPWETAVIQGWRTSLEHVRQFVFVDEQRSYASRTGQANGDMGWIRLLAFEEDRPVAINRLRDDRRRKGWLRGETQDELGRLEEADRDNAGKEKEGSADAEAPAAPEARTQKLAPQTLEGVPRADESFPGTGWGDRKRDTVRRTWFVPALAASDHIVLRYEYASGLTALGILPEWERLDVRERGEFGFARAPRW